MTWTKVRHVPKIGGGLLWRNTNSNLSYLAGGQYIFRDLNGFLNSQPAFAFVYDFEPAPTGFQARTFDQRQVFSVFRFRSVNFKMVPTSSKPWRALRKTAALGESGTDEGFSCCSSAPTPANQRAATAAHIALRKSTNVFLIRTSNNCAAGRFGFVDILRCAGLHHPRAYGLFSLIAPSIIFGRAWRATVSPRGSSEACPPQSIWPRRPWRPFKQAARCATSH